jgi:antitoxin ParD1/3/4
LTIIGIADNMKAQGGVLMETMNISLPDPLKQFVDSQVASGAYSSASEYIRRLIREDQERRQREEVDRKLLEALDAGPSTPLTAEDWQDIRREVRRRAAKRAGQ